MTRRAVLMLALLGVLAGCVSLQRGGLFEPGQDRIFVEFLTNKTFFRDVQFRLTERVVEEILSRPGLHLTSKEEADVVLTGRVTNVQQSVLSETPTQITNAESTAITVEIELHDAHTGEMIKKRTLSQRSEFVPALGQSRDSARAEVYRLLARDIVRQLEVEF